MKSGLPSIQRMKNLTSMHNASPQNNNAYTSLPPLSRHSLEGRARMGDTVAKLQLAALLVDVNPQRSNLLLQEAAKTQNPNILFQFAVSMSGQTKVSALKAAANANHSKAAYEYGRLLETGSEGVTQDLDEAKKYYQASADAGNPKAMVRCGQFCKEVDPKRALAYFKEAAGKNVAEGLYEYAIYEKEGQQIPIDLESACKHFHQAADLGDGNAMYEYSQCLRLGIGCDKDVEQSNIYLQKAIECNNPNAKLTYAQLNEDDDCSSAEAIFYELAQQGNPSAQNAYASLAQRRGEMDTARSYYEMAANQKYIPAITNLAMLDLHRADISPECKTAALEKLKEAAGMGYSRAQFNYALRLERGDDGQPDLIKAFYYYSQAANQGLPSALCNLGLLYLNGRGVQKDISKACENFKEAADQGSVIAQYKYGKLLKSQNMLEKAAHYFTLAAELKHPRAAYEAALLTRNPELEKKYLKFAAEHDVTRAMIKYGDKLHQNHDDEQALIYYKQAADKGSIKGKAKLAMLLLSQGEDALALLKEAADGGNEAAIQEYARIIEEQNNSDDLEDASYDSRPIDQAVQKALTMIGTPNESVGVKMIAEAALTRSAEAKYQYGYLLEQGQVVKKSILEAQKFYLQAIKAKHPMACYRYGNLIKRKDLPAATEYFKMAAEQGVQIAVYAYGKALEENGQKEEAIKCYKKAADEGKEPRAMFILAKRLEEENNQEAAIKYYEEAANAGFMKAQNNMGRILELGLGLPKDIEKAVVYYKQGHSQGCIQSSLNLARCKEHGIGIAKSTEEAAQIYRAIADAKLSEKQKPLKGLAQFNYGRMLHNGIGIQQDFDEAKKYYLLAINNGIVQAKQNYGVLLFATYHKWNEAARYFEMAANAGDEFFSAKYNYAMLLLQGMGVNEDKSLAESLLQQASEGNFIPAMFSYAQLLEGKAGKDEKDSETIKKAAEIYERAALAPDPEKKYLKPQRDAQYNLAMMIASKKPGVEYDEAKYTKFITMAANNKHPDAEAKIEPAFEMKLLL